MAMNHENTYLSHIKYCLKPSSTVTTVRNSCAISVDRLHLYNIRIK